jgi:hypothetical protein
MKKAILKSYKVISKTECKINEADPNAVSLQQVKHSTEALPICVAPYSITVHYTDVNQEVTGADT